MPERYSTYLADALNPRVPCVLLGRSASLPPKTGKEYAVYDWWNDPCIVIHSCVFLKLSGQVSLPPLSVILLLMYLEFQTTFRM